MKRSLSIIFTASILLSIIYIAIYANLLAVKARDTYRAGDDIERVEDLIIIDGLKMFSESPLRDEDQDSSPGTIIYDDSFDNTIIDYDLADERNDHATEGDRSKDHSSDKKEIARIPFNEDLIRQLNKEDKRWHVTSHRIKEGENLWNISLQYKTDHTLIIKANYIKNPDVLKIGNMIYVPNRIGIRYTVRKGDSIIMIAERYKIKKEMIFAHNSLKETELRIGERIFLPDARNNVKTEDSPHRSIKKSTRVARLKSRIQFSWPLRGKITSTFGKRTDPFTKKKKFHCGLDISANIGTPIKAAKSGKVIFSGWKDGYGNVVILRHENGYITVYAHNRKNTVNEDEAVKTGQVIAFSGMTGAVTGAHLHFEIRKYLTPLNPLRFLR
jgi:murein DD-endopeptidase MepM/ murein hydrolase activator NlpD